MSLWFFAFNMKWGPTQCSLLVMVPGTWRYGFEAGWDRSISWVIINSHNHCNFIRLRKKNSNLLLRESRVWFMNTYTPIPHWYMHSTWNGCKLYSTEIWNQREIASLHRPFAPHAGDKGTTKTWTNGHCIQFIVIRTASKSTARCE